MDVSTPTFNRPMLHPQKSPHYSSPALASPYSSSPPYHDHTKMNRISLSNSSEDEQALLDLHAGKGGKGQHKEKGRKQQRAKDTHHDHSHHHSHHHHHHHDVPSPSSPSGMNGRAVVHSSPKLASPSVVAASPGGGAIAAPPIDLSKMTERQQIAYLMSQSAGNTTDSPALLSSSTEGQLFSPRSRKRSMSDSSGSVGTTPTTPTMAATSIPHHTNPTNANTTHHHHHHHHHASSSSPAHAPPSLHLDRHSHSHHNSNSNDTKEEQDTSSTLTALSNASTNSEGFHKRRKQHDRQVEKTPQAMLAKEPKVEADKSVCFHCKQVGRIGSEVYKCKVHQCSKYYHWDCVSSLRLARLANTFTHRFNCPLHYCEVCGVSGDGRQSVHCSLCPTAFHVTCMPSSTRMLGAEKGKETRKTGLIVCPHHKDDVELPPDMITVGATDEEDTMMEEPANTPAATTAVATPIPPTERLAVTKRRKIKVKGRDNETPEELGEEAEGSEADADAENAAGEGGKGRRGEHLRNGQRGNGLKGRQQQQRKDGETAQGSSENEDEAADNTTKEGGEDHPAGPEETTAHSPKRRVRPRGDPSSSTSASSFSSNTLSSDTTVNTTTTSTLSSSSSNIDISSSSPPLYSLSSPFLDHVLAELLVDLAESHTPFLATQQAENPIHPKQKQKRMEKIRALDEKAKEEIQEHKESLVAERNDYIQQLDAEMQKRISTAQSQHRDMCAGVDQSLVSQLRSWAESNRATMLSPDPPAATLQAQDQEEEEDTDPKQ